MGHYQNAHNATQSKILKFYSEKVLGEIKGYWNYLYSQPSCDDDFYNRLNDRSPWFGNMWEFFFVEKDKNTSVENGEAYLGKNCLPRCLPKEITEKLPKGFQKSFKQLACELDYLFPTTCIIRAYPEISDERG